MNRLDWILQDIQRLSRQELKFLVMRVLELIEERARQEEPVPAATPAADSDDIPLELLMARSPAVELDEEMAEDHYLQDFWPGAPEA